MATTLPKIINSNLIKLLASPPPRSITATKIDFETLGFPNYRDHFAVLIDDVFSETECQALLECAEASADQKWEQAMVNVGNGQQMLSTDVRLCDRILWDDHEVAAGVLNRVVPYLPPNIIELKDNPIITGRGPTKRKETWRLSRLNERLRFLKYTKGMYFRMHCDGSYITPDKKEITFLTVHLYLNGNDAPSAAQWGAEKDQDKPLLGGATRFFDVRGENYWDVSPKLGSVLVFQHRNLLHSGDDVRQGTKYTMRSDILYRKVEE